VRLPLNNEDSEWRERMLLAIHTTSGIFYGMEPHAIKTLAWVGSSQDDLRKFPEEVKDMVGYALYLAQTGAKHPAAKPLKGFTGAGILEIVEDHHGDTYRAVYTVRFGDAVYVLHVFQKKSKHGIATMQKDIDLIKSRSNEFMTTMQKGRGRAMEEIINSSGNVFEDLGLSEPSDRLAKAELARELAEIITKRHLSQTEAAQLLGVDQPKISNIMNGRLSGFSLERLIQFLNSLGRDVQIVVKQKRRSQSKGGLKVVCP